MKPLEERFWAKVQVFGPGDCWLWQGATNGRGYGVIGLGSRREGHSYAHRLAYELHYGHILKGAIVCHHCDNPGCCNWAHLFLGNHKSNCWDAIRKGRWDPHHNNQRGPCGEAHGMARLTAAQVAWLRARAARGEPRKALAARFGISLTHVHQIINQTRWRTV